MMDALVIFSTFLISNLVQFTLSKTICCDTRIGCFNDQMPFSKMPLPDCPGKINVQFTLFNMKNYRYTGRYMNRDILPTFWNKERKTVFLVHGYLQSGSATWIQSLKNAFLNKKFDKKESWNVVIVDWSGGARKTWYPSAASNVRTVGAEIALVIRNMIQHRPEHYIYCVGHSLGAHVCGHAGMLTRVDRITGLDPAGPWFENEDRSIGLNPEAASYVDVIHTHGLAHMTAVFNLGTLKPMGHADFYPNGGDRQPGCYLDPIDIIKTGVDSGFAELFKKTISQTSEMGLNLLGGDVPGTCSHQRVIEFFKESLYEDCKFTVRQKCTDPHKMPESCDTFDHDIQEMGFYAGNKTNYHKKGIFYLETNRRAPFCRG